MTEVTAVGEVSVEAAVEEEHVPREVATFVRGRPVEAAAAHIADRSPVAAASGRQEDRTMRLKRVSPNRGTDHIAAETCTALVGTIQSVITATPVIGQQDYPVYVVHICLGIAYAR